MSDSENLNDVIVGSDVDDDGDLIQEQCDREDVEGGDGYDDDDERSSDDASVRIK